MNKIQKAHQTFSEDGIGALYSEIKTYTFKNIAKCYPSTNIYEKDWDILVILDACRSDLFREVYPQYDFMGNFSTINSVGSKTPEWIHKTFIKKYFDEISNTIYISGNPNSAKIDESKFQRVEHLWNSIWDDEIGTMPPRPITDYGINISRDESPDRLILHYMQPHYPFVNYPSLDQGIPKERLNPPYYGENANKSVWQKLEDKELDKETVWEAYKDNLEYVLDDITMLVENVDAKLVISSDHGNALGEFGIYGHPYGRPIPSLRKVPWIEIAARNTNEYNPVLEYPGYEDTHSASIEEKLSSLGYL